MSEIQVSTRAPEHWFAMAGMHQGLPANTSKSGIVRMALAIFNGMPPRLARELAAPKVPTGKGIDSDSESMVDFSCKVPAEIASFPEDIHPAYAVRIGIAMSMGYSRETAEKYAKLSHGGWPKGRPRKVTSNETQSAA